ncbi:hypothetical protein NLJ89_g3269 [Agrocybe chaxingu]|uniref:Uncharacterized protein n=1 Tax=Agrocybe chaxingu TaxID=84603 RepID=A0A9W8K4Z3_9AGAR|nr:hypothetical protein NLJ89_g3269 [Agrocybe chaxingu]
MSSPDLQPTRLIIVDDTDPGIVYHDDGWFRDQGSHDGDGLWGPAFQSTLHGTIFNSSFSFSFSGTYVQVLGFNQIRSDSGIVDPTVECTIDDIPVVSSAPSALVANNWPFCGKEGLSDGIHNLTVRVTVTNRQTFWFDAIRYHPSADVPLDDKTILVDSKDPAFQWGDFWRPLDGFANMSIEESAFVRFEFYGVSLSWYGVRVASALSRDASTGFYDLDNGTLVAFSLKPIPAGSQRSYNQKIFETSVYPQGKHELFAVYAGIRDQSPLTLDYVVIKNGSTSTNSTVTTVTAPSTADPTAPSTADPTAPPSSDILVSESSGKSVDAGVIVGSVVGTLSFVAVFLLSIWFLRRRSQRRLQQQKEAALANQANIVDPWFQPGPNPDIEWIPEMQILLRPESPSNTSDKSPSFKYRPLINAFGISEDGAYDPRISLVDGSQYANQFGRTSEQGGSSTSSARRDQEFAKHSKSPLRYDSPSPTPSRLVLHTDSGVRLSAQPDQNVVEIPPVYTPG